MMQDRSIYRRPENRPMAFVLAIVGMAAFTPIFAAGKLADGLLPVAVLVWLRFLGGAVTVLCVAAVKGVPLHRRWSPLWKLHLLRAVCGVGGLGCAVYAASHLPLADATAIGLTKGILAIALAGLILREVVTGRHWLVGGLSAFGAYLVVRANETGTEPTGFVIAGIAAAALSAVFMAAETLIIRYLAQREDTVTILSYVNVLAACLLAGPVIWIIHSSGITAGDLILFAWLGPLAIAGQAFNISAYRRAGAATLAPIHYSSVLLSAVFAFFIWGEVPTPYAIAGAVLILAGGAVLTVPFAKRGRCQAT